MRNWKVAVLSVLLILLAPTNFVIAQQSSSEEAPKLEHFDPNMVDKTLDPCQDFYQFVCSKWNAAHPIPPDQVAWGTGSGLSYWNENILREAMETASSESKSRSDFEQKIGDYWGACTNETALEAAGIRDLKPEIARIDSMKTKAELAGRVAHIHMLIPGAWE